MQCTIFNNIFSRIQSDVYANRCLPRLILLVALSMLSCENYTDSGIFFDIENVVRVVEEDRGLSERAGIQSFVALGGHYYLTTTQLLVRVAGENNAGRTGFTWRAAAHPNGYPLAVKVARHNGNLLVLFATNAADPQLDLFESNGEISYANAGSVIWNRITPAGLASNETLNNFFIVEGGAGTESVIVEMRQHRFTGENTVANPVFAHQLINISASPQVSLLPSAEPLPFVDIEYDGGSLYWFINPDKIFSTANLAQAASLQALNLAEAPFTQNETALRDTRPATPLIYGFAGIERNSANLLYLVSEGSYVFEYNTSTATWTSLTNEGAQSPMRFADASSNNSIFTDVIVVPAAFNTNEQIYATTQNEGYVFIESGNPRVRYLVSASDLISTNYFSTLLSNGHVSSLYYAEATNELFALTPNNGLYRSIIESGGYHRWAWERRPQM